jgi:hypothetical protein
MANKDMYIGGDGGFGVVGGVGKMVFYVYDRNRPLAPILRQKRVMSAE